MTLLSSHVYVVNVFHYCGENTRIPQVNCDIVPLAYSRIGWECEIEESRKESCKDSLIKPYQSMSKSMINTLRKHIIDKYSSLLNITDNNDITVTCYDNTMLRIPEIVRDNLKQGYYIRIQITVRDKQTKDQAIKKLLSKDIRKLKGEYLFPFDIKSLYVDDQMKN